VLPRKDERNQPQKSIAVIFSSESLLLSLTWLELEEASAAEHGV
jgi:hypothetical protein